MHLKCTLNFVKHAYGIWKVPLLWYQGLAKPRIFRSLWLKWSAISYLLWCGRSSQLVWQGSRELLRAFYVVNTGWTASYWTYPARICSRYNDQRYALPILNIFVPQLGHTPWVAGLPFFMVIDFASFISFLDLHLTQYACTITTSFMLIMVWTISSDRVRCQYSGCVAHFRVIWSQLKPCWADVRLSLGLARWGAHVV